MMSLSSTRAMRGSFGGRVVCAVLAAAVAAGCQTTAPSDGSQWISAEQAQAEFESEARKLTLAPGWDWPQGSQYKSIAQDGKKNNYGVNTGRVDAAWFWHCTWGRTYFDATSNGQRQGALERVLELRESAFYHYGLADEDKGPRDKILALVEAGDTKQLREIIDINCPRKEDLPHHDETYNLPMRDRNA